MAQESQWNKIASPANKTILIPPQMMSPKSLFKPWVQEVFWVLSSRHHMSGGSLEGKLQAG